MDVKLPRRHKGLSLSSPEVCSLARAPSFNKHNVQTFFTNLENVLSRLDCFADGTRIFNLDETATTTVQRPQRILAEKGLKSMCQVTSGEKGVTCAIISASGQYIPPAMIFPRVHFKAHMLKGAPAGTLGLANQSAWMNSDLFLEVVAHFVKHTCSSKSNPTLLIYDNHDSHLSLAVLDYAKENGVTILTLPPHSTNKMQPLDIGFFGPFKAAYNTAVDSWLLCNPGKLYTIYDVAQCVGLVFEKAMSSSNIISAFKKKTGIFPLDKNVFSDIDFLPSSVTDRVESVGQTGPISEQHGPANTSSESGPLTPTRNQIHEQIPSPNVASEITEPVASTSATFISLEIFRGFPKAGDRKRVRKGRRPRRSLIATDTPEKEEIAKRSCNKIKKEAKKVKKRVLQESSSDEVSLHLVSEMDSKTFELNEEMTFNSNKTPEESDYLLMKFNGRGKPIFYVGKAIGDLNDEGNIDVSFLRIKMVAFLLCQMYLTWPRCH